MAAGAALEAGVADAAPPNKLGVLDAAGAEVAVVVDADCPLDGAKREGLAAAEVVAAGWDAGALPPPNCPGPDVAIGGLANKEGPEGAEEVFPNKPPCAGACEDAAPPNRPPEPPAGWLVAVVAAAAGALDLAA